jgi:hypothetical protein
MAAMHGRHDPLLDPARFPRFLRQANDAEMADVRKIGDDEYEVSPHRSSGIQPVSAPASTPAAASSQPAAATETVSIPVETSGETTVVTRENGQRLGVRFRRGSRSPIRAGEIPLVGVVEIDLPAALAPPEEDIPATPSEPATEKPARPRRAPRKRAAAAATTAAPPAAEDAKTPPAKRPRSRARKKAAE